MSIVDERTGIVTWDISSGSDDYMLLVLSVLQELCGSPNSDINKINDFIKALQDRILFLDDVTDFPLQGDDNTLYMLKNDTLTMKAGTYKWDGNEYKYFNEFNASEISYDDTESELEIDNVQDAIDKIVELNEDNIKSCGNYEIGKTYDKNDMFKYNNALMISKETFVAGSTIDYSKIDILRDIVISDITIPTSAWVNKEYTYTMNGITDDDLAIVWFKDVNIAEDSEIIAETVEGGVKFKCNTVPSSALILSMEVKKV